MRPADLGAAEGAFWLVLTVALLFGGARAVSGLPSLLGVFLPDGFMAAQAERAGPAGRRKRPPASAAAGRGAGPWGGGGPAGCSCGDTPMPMALTLLAGRY